MQIFLLKKFPYLSPNTLFSMLPIHSKTPQKSFLSFFTPFFFFSTYSNQASAPSPLLKQFKVMCDSVKSNGQLHIIIFQNFSIVFDTNGHCLLLETLSSLDIPDSVIYYFLCVSLTRSYLLCPILNVKVSKAFVLTVFPSFPKPMFLDAYIQ